MGFMHIKTLKRSTVTILILHTKVLRLNNISKVTDLVSSREEGLAGPNFSRIKGSEYLCDL